MIVVMLSLKPFDLPTIDQYRGLICDPAVTRHMPLAETTYSDDWISSWISAKKATWPQGNLGPWSLWSGDEFAGWCGLEPDGEHLSVGIVLHKKFWGRGEEVLELMLKAWGDTLTGRKLVAEFPQSRKSERWALGLGLKPLDTISIGGNQFLRYELPRR